MQHPMSDEQNNPMPSGSRSVLGIVVQIVGFGIGIALLGWAVQMALREENRQQLHKLSDATPGELMLLLVLAALSVGFNGIIFWVVINPIRRLRATDVIAVNAIATFLAYLPFKLSMVARFVIHNRRDKVPILMIGAWLIAVAALMASVIVPLTLTSVWLKQVNLLWWVVSLVGVFACTWVGVLLSRWLSGEAGVRRLSRLGLGDRITRSDAFSRVHSGFEMLGNPRASLIANAFRLADIIGFALRFFIAARVLELPITMQDSLLLGASYFLIGAASPAGMLGTREAGTIWVAQLVGISAGALSETDSGQIPIAATVLLVTAVEAVVNLGCAGFGIAWLKARKPLLPDESAEGESAQTELIERAVESE